MNSKALANVEKLWVQNEGFKSLVSIQHSGVYTGGHFPYTFSCSHVSQKIRLKNRVFCKFVQCTKLNLKYAFLYIARPVSLHHEVLQISILIIWVIFLNPNIIYKTHKISSSGRDFQYHGNFNIFEPRLQLQWLMLLIQEKLLGNTTIGFVRSSICTHAIFLINAIYTQLDKQPTFHQH